MGDLPDDDAPTMTGTPGDRHVGKDVLEGDTTDASLEPPEAEAKEAHDEEDRTVQQKVSPPLPARKPAEVTAPPPEDPPTSPRAPPASALAASAIPSTEPSKIPSTEPSKGVVPPPVLPPVAPPLTSTRTPAIEDDDEVEDKTSIDALDAADDSITATAPSFASMKLPPVTTGTVEIRNLDADEDEEDAGDPTEVRPRPGLVPLNVPAATRAALGPQPSQPPPPPRPAAGRPAPSKDKEAAPLTVASATASTAVAAVPPPPDDDEDEGVTRQAAAPQVGSVPDIGPTRPGVSVGRGSSPSVLTISGEPATQPGLELPTRPGAGDASKNSYANEDDDDDSDESITKRGPIPLPAKHAKTAASPAASPLEDSVTAQAPNVPPELVAAATASSRAKKIQSDPTLDDGVGDTTKRVKVAAPLTRTVVSASASPADGETDSVTAQAPLTHKILRVIANAEPSPKEASDEAPLEDDEPEENRTAVMANAPLKRIIAEIVGSSALPPIRPTGPNLPTNMGPMGAAAPRLQADSESGLRIARGSSSDERGSFGMPAAPEARPSGIARSAAGSENRLIDVHGATDLAMPNFTQPQPSLHDVDLTMGPRYGLLVAIVAVISLLVPLTLFFALNRGPEATPPPEPAEAVSEIEKPDPPRAKAERKNGITVSPPPSGSASGKGRGAFRR